MNKERDFLPWILGALSATAVAVAITAVSSNRTVPREPPTPVLEARSTAARVSQALAPSPVRPAADAAPADAAAVAAALEPQPDPSAQSPSAQAQAAAESPGPSGQIWECTTKGVKTFSNNPCGDRSTRLEVGPINTMQPMPAVHYARASEPRYTSAYAESDGSADQEPYDQANAESAGNSYAIIRGVGFVARRRPEHPHHRSMPNHRNFGPTARKY